MRFTSLGVLVAASLGVSACGYELAGSAGANDGLGLLAVTAAPTIVASSAAEEALLSGAREELAAAGRLATCDPRSSVEVCPAIVLELVRVEEGGAAPALGPSGLPQDKAVTFFLRGRALLRRTPTAAPSRVGPDVTEREILAPAEDSRLAEVRRQEAIRRAARRLGVRLVRTIVW